MPQIREIIANKKNYGGVRNTYEWIPIHYTANDGDSAKNNGLYFANNVTGTSAHFFADDIEIIRSVPENHIAYAVEGKNYGGRLHGIVTNANSINIELCDTVRNGTIAPSKETIENALELVRMLMRKYNIPQDHVIRHYDVTGKACPAYWVNDARWKAEFWDRITESTPIQYTPITPEDRAVYRLYNPNSGEHVFTIAAEEGNNLLSLGWNYEGIAWKVPEGAAVPVFRLYNPYIGEHLYTTNDMERAIIAVNGWKDEGIAFLSGGSTEVFRLYDGEARHMFTASGAEREELEKAGWRYEGTGWYCE